MRAQKSLMKNKMNYFSSYPPQSAFIYIRRLATSLVVLLLMPTKFNNQIRIEICSNWVNFNESKFEFK